MMIYIHCRSQRRVSFGGRVFMDQEISRYVTFLNI